MKTMTFPTVVLISLLALLTANASAASREFLAASESALDAVDKLETIFSDPDAMKIEARITLNELETALKKYERYEPENKTEAQLVLTLELIHFQYLTISSGSIDDKHLEDARKEAQEARALYKKCKAKKK